MPGKAAAGSDAAVAAVAALLGSASAGGAPRGGAPAPPQDEAALLQALAALASADPATLPPDAAALLASLNAAGGGLQAGAAPGGPGSKPAPPGAVHVTPTPGFVVKTTTLAPYTPPSSAAAASSGSAGRGSKKSPASPPLPAGSKLFINVTSSEHVAAPKKSKVMAPGSSGSSGGGQSDGTPEEGFMVPLAMGEVRVYSGKAGGVASSSGGRPAAAEPASSSSTAAAPRFLVVDVIVAPSVVAQCESDLSGSYRHWLIGLAFEYAARKHSLTLNPSYKLPASSYKTGDGAVASQMLRKAPTRAGIEEVGTGAAAAASTASSVSSDSLLSQLQAEGAIPAPLVPFSAAAAAKAKKAAAATTTPAAAQAASADASKRPAKPVIPSAPLPPMDIRLLSPETSVKDKLASDVAGGLAAQAGGEGGAAAAKMLKVVGGSNDDEGGAADDAEAADAGLTPVRTAAAAPLPTPLRVHARYGQEEPWEDCAWQVVGTAGATATLPPVLAAAAAAAGAAPLALLPPRALPAKGAPALDAATAPPHTLVITAGLWVPNLGRPGVTGAAIATPPPASAVAVRLLPPPSAGPDPLPAVGLAALPEAAATSPTPYALASKGGAVAAVWEAPPVSAPRAGLLLTAPGVRPVLLGLPPLFFPCATAPPHVVYDAACGMLQVTLSQDAGVAETLARRVAAVGEVWEGWLAKQAAKGEEPPSPGGLAARHAATAQEAETEDGGASASVATVAAWVEAGAVASSRPDPGSRVWAAGGLPKKKTAPAPAPASSSAATASAPSKPVVQVIRVDADPEGGPALPEDAFHAQDALSMHHIQQRKLGAKKAKEGREAGDAGPGQEDEGEGGTGPAVTTETLPGGPTLAPAPRLLSTAAAGLLSVKSGAVLDLF